MQHSYYNATLWIYWKLKRVEKEDLIVLLHFSGHKSVVFGCDFEKSVKETKKAIKEVVVNFMTFIGQGQPFFKYNLLS